MTMIGEPRPADAVMLLVHAVDEMRETTNLLRVADLERSTRRSWWRNIWSWLASGGAEVSAGFAVQYLTENIRRSRGHWSEALALIIELQQSLPDDEVVAGLVVDLYRAGWDDVLATLQPNAIPRSTADAGAHLAGVVGTIRECESLASSARSKLLLRGMRDEQTEPPLR